MLSFVSKSFLHFYANKTDTASIDKFLRDHGFRWAVWTHSSKNKWGGAYHYSNFEKIFLVSTLGLLMHARTLFGGLQSFANALARGFPGLDLYYSSEMRIYGID